VVFAPPLGISPMRGIEFRRSSFSETSATCIARIPTFLDQRQKPLEIVRLLDVRASRSDTLRLAQEAQSQPFRL
jgi:hypothetical protein